MAAAPPANFAEFFLEITGKPPYPFQERLCENLLSGRSMIFRAPTGAGKTWAAVAPFLYSRLRGTPIADRLLYALPLRSLAASLHRSVSDALQRRSGLWEGVMCEGKDRDYQSGNLFCSLQMGGQSHDPFLESDLVFSTIDQVLSTYLFLPVSVSDRLANINAGALIGSYVVFDELHALDARTALGTVIEMLDRLGRLCQFTMMTATLSEEAVAWLAAKFGAEVMDLSKEEVRSQPSQRTKRRTWVWRGEGLTAAHVIEKHDVGRSIALVNTVGRAQALFKELSDLLEGMPTRTLLLHSRFYPEDRRAVELVLDDCFGETAAQTDVILVTTQVIEAGIDISADHLHTELAPMNALVQRAGRVARYPHRNIGDVSVYEVPDCRPYEDAEEIFEATRARLRSLPPEGRAVDYFEEQTWVDGIHRRSEMEILRGYENLYSRRKDVHAAMDEGDRSKLASLVRDAQSVNLLITSRPEEANFSGRDSEGRRIGWPKMLSVPLSSVMGLARALETTERPAWVAKAPEFDDSESGRSVFSGWKILQSAGELRASWMLAVHPDYARYDKQVGLTLGEGGNERELEYDELPPLPRYQYEFESWSDHAHRVVAEATRMSAVYARGTSVLTDYLRGLGWDTMGDRDLEELVELTCLLHDTGKLTAEWQGQAWKWQKAKDARASASGLHVPIRPNVPLAHTWFDSKDDWHYRGRPEYRFPNHAVEGAFACANGLFTHLEKVLGEDAATLACRCIVTAIARHHSPRAHSLGPFTFRQRGANLAGEAADQQLPRIDLCEADRLDREEFGKCLLYFQEEGGRGESAQAWPLYAFLVRRLRLADQASLKERLQGLDMFGRL